MTSALAAAAAAFERTLEDLGIAEPADPVELGRRAALLVAAESVWQEQLGLLLDGQQAQQLLGVGSRQAVHDLVRRRRLLGLRGRGGRLLFPAFQFGGSGRPLAALPAILDLFADAVATPYTVASWFTTPQALLDGETPASWLRRSGDAAQAVEAARRSAARLAQ